MAQIRIEESRAERLLSERLRGQGLAPADANAFAAKLVQALLGATPRSNFVGKSWRIISPHPTPEMLRDIEENMTSWARGERSWGDAAEHLWEMVYEHGLDVTEDVNAILHKLAPPPSRG
jgi:hypothetical protein